MRIGEHPATLAEPLSAANEDRAAACAAGVQIAQGDLAERFPKSIVTFSALGSRSMTSVPNRAKPRIVKSCVVGMTSPEELTVATFNRPAGA